MLLATIAALLAAALFGVSTALQHRSAGLVDANAPGGADLAGFISGTLRHRLWIVGMLVGIAGFGLHALALSAGPLALVQPLLVSSVIFGLALRQVVEHRRPLRRELAWAATLVVGLVVFLTISTPAAGVDQPPDTLPTIVLGGLIGAGILGCFVVGRRAGGSVGAALLGTAAGLSYAATAGLLKEVMGTLDHGLGAVATSWPFYAFMVVGLLGLLLNQLAYQAGPLSASLPVMTTVDPLVSLVIGVAVFDEGFRNGPVDLAGEAFGLVLVVAAALRLTMPAPRVLQVPIAATPDLVGAAAGGLGAPGEHRATVTCSPGPKAL